MDRKVSLSLIICQGISLLFLVTGVSSDAVVQMEDTEIGGEDVVFEGKPVHRFIGIPYAKPPVGDGRFKKPEPFRDYPPQFQATTPPPACRQYTETDFPWYFNDQHRNEDCLYLNIWRPADASPQNPKQVFVFVHSGQHKLGSASLERYPGEPLVALGDIVFVTLQYRLGIFGFLSSNTKEAPGNAGLYDILEALKWIKKYISFFGGIPSQVTLGGHSSSATLVAYLALNPEANDLFHKIIMQSGYPVNFQTEYKQRNIELGKQVAAVVGCDKNDLAEFGPNTIQCLKGVDADVLENAEFKMNPSSPASWHPISGDDLVPNNPRKSILSGNFQGKPLLIGNTKDEGSIVASLINTKHFGFYGTNDIKVNGDLVTEMIGTIMKILPDLSLPVSAVSPPDLPSLVTPAVPDNPLIKSLPDPKSALTAIPVDKLPGIPDIASLLTKSILDGSSSSPDCMLHQLQNLFGDLVLTCPSVYFAEKCAEQGSDVFYYLFVHRPSNSLFAPWMGVTHYAEVPFVFGDPLIKPDSYTPQEIELSRRLIGYWTSFVKTGKPGVAWPKYTKQDPIYTVLDVGNATRPYGKGPHTKNCNLLRPLNELL